MVDTPGQKKYNYLIRTTLKLGSFRTAAYDSCASPVSSCSSPTSKATFSSFSLAALLSVHCLASWDVAPQEYQYLGHPLYCSFQVRKSSALLAVPKAWMIFGIFLPFLTSSTFTLLIWTLLYGAGRVILSHLLTVPNFSMAPLTSSLSVSGATSITVITSDLLVIASARTLTSPSKPGNRKTYIEFEKTLMGPISDKLGVEQGGCLSDRLYKLANNVELDITQQSTLGVTMCTM